jgi:hypothetical protein
MMIVQHTRRFGVLASAVSLSAMLAVAANAQQGTSPAPSDSGPPAVRIEPMPQPPAGATQREVPRDREMGAQKPDADKAPADSADASVGMPVFTSDGRKVGEVKDVKSAPDGKASVIHVSTGGFLGFGVKIVEIPAGLCELAGRNVQLGLTYDEVTKLPVVGERAG